MMTPARRDRLIHDPEYDGMSAGVPETWTSRDLPVLTIVLRRFEAGQTGVNPEDIRAELGMDGPRLRAALVALRDAGYLDVHLAGGWTAEHAAGLITSVSERTRRELGSWPSPERVLDQLVGALAQAAEAEREPEHKRRLRAGAELLGGMARDIAVQVIAKQLGRVG